MVYQERELSPYEDITPTISTTASSPYTPGSESYLLHPRSPRSHNYEVLPEADASRQAQQTSGSPSIKEPYRIGPVPASRTRSRSMRLKKGPRTLKDVNGTFGGVHWYVPSSMVATFLFGLGGAIAHHMYYSTMSGQPATDQLWRLRIGTGLAFFTKAALVGSCVLAYRQRIWHTLREKAVSMRGIDALFAIVEDPSWFLMSMEMLRKAKIASLMALATWLIPLASVISPGALTTELKEVQYPAETCTVNNLDFTREARSNWRHPFSGRPGSNMAFFNTTPPPPATAKYDWFDQPSFQADRTAKLSIFGQQIVPEKKSPCPGFNCTYTMDFVGPWYNCTAITFEDTHGNLSETDFVPKSPPHGKNYVYQATFDKEYEKPQPHYNDKTWVQQGIFTNEPIIYFGYVVDTGTPVKDAPPDARWNTTIETHVYKCIHQKANYTVETSFVNDRPTRKQTVTDGHDLLPAGHTMSPKVNSSAYNEFTAYHAVGLLARQNIEGTISQNNMTADPFTTSEVTKANLVNSTTSFALANFTTGFQYFYESIVLSYLSDPLMEVTVTNHTTQCVRTRWETRWLYHPESLWIGYGIAVCVAFTCIIAGGIAIWENGMASDTTFSKILATTRNETLDHLVKTHEGACFGGELTPSDLDTKELQFGVLESVHGLEGQRIVTHTGFGSVGEVERLHRSDVLKVARGQDEDGTSRGPWISGAGLGALPG